MSLNTDTIAEISILNSPLTNNRPILAPQLLGFPTIEVTKATLAHNTNVAHTLQTEKRVYERNIENKGVGMKKMPI